MSRFQHRARLSTVLRRALPLLLLAGLAGCVAEQELPVGEVAEALTTTLFSSVSLAKGASRNSTYTAPETGTLTFKTSGTGDADLYVKRGTGASRTTYDCKSETGTSVEQCSLSVTAGDVLSYSVYAYAASTVTLTATSEAATPPPGSTTTTTLVAPGALAAGVKRTGIFTAPAAGTLVFSSSGTGDVDLYVRRGTTVTTTVSDCKSEGAGAAESCSLTVTAGQQVAWLLNAYTASNAGLTVTAPNATTPPPPPVTTVLIPSGSVAKGQSRTGSYVVTVAGAHVFKTAGTGDVDLYVRKGAAPTTTVADCKSETGTAVETCTVTAAVGDVLYYLVYGYAASTAELTLTSPG